jgi:uncharacterized membrane protein
MQLILEPYVLGVISALLAMLFFGVTNILYKKMSEDISVMDIMFTRMWVSLPIAYLFAVAASGSIIFAIPLDAYFPLILSMIIGIVIGDGMYFLSQERIGVARAFPIAMSYPLLVYFLAAVFLGEPVIPQRVIGAIIIVIGVIMIARAEQDESKNDKRWSKDDIRIGIILAFLVFFCWAASDVKFLSGVCCFLDTCTSLPLNNERRESISDQTSHGLCVVNWHYCTWFQSHNLQLCSQVCRSNCNISDNRIWTHVHCPAISNLFG